MLPVLLLYPNLHSADVASFTAVSKSPQHWYRQFYCCIQISTALMLPVLLLYPNLHSAHVASFTAVSKSPQRWYRQFYCCIQISKALVLPVLLLYPNFHSTGTAALGVVVQYESSNRIHASNSLYRKITLDLDTHIKERKRREKKHIHQE